MAIAEALAADNPDAAAAKRVLATTLAAAGEYNRARDIYRTLQEQFPHENSLRISIAQLRTRAGDPDVSRVTINAALAHSPKEARLLWAKASHLEGTYRDDPESLDTAWTIVRRFRDTELPTTQDTYGWLTHLRGASVDTLPYLQAAAAGLDDDLIVQYHLGNVLFALGRSEEALAQFRATLDTAGIGDTRPMIETARSRIAEIEAFLDAEASETE